jgi:dTDP-4-dehydrorhamnose reductase
VSDKHGTPTFTYDMSDLIAKVIATGRYGLYHAVNARMTNRYEIAKKIVEILGKKDVKITPVNSSFFPLPAPRAESEAMVNYKLDLLGLNTMPRWEDSLKKYLLTQLEF